MPLSLETPALVATTPPIRRSPMAYRVPPKQHQKTPPWSWSALRRRVSLACLVLLSAAWGGSSLNFVLTENHVTALRVPVVALFSLLFGWIAFSFWIALCGFGLLITRRDRFAVGRVPLERGPLPEEARTCIVMPIYNEDTAMVFSNLRAVHLSLNKTGQAAHFDIFVLSDSTEPALFAAEETACDVLRRETSGARIFYRRRKRRTQKKSGNIADFCRRWGSQYRYMIVLDADSLITGELACQLVRRMEQRPDIGVLQTVPKSINQTPLLARIQQFTGQLYGPLFTAGFHFWQLGDAGFWGHNAILRLEPFMKYCTLPRLSGPPPFGGDILSHDFVEAALLRRAGYGVWLDLELQDSYEEPPASLLEELSRDRRWCQGNLQHLRFLFMRGLSFGHRLLFVIGNFFYFSSLFWFLFLVTVTASFILSGSLEPDYFPDERALFPHWPVYHGAISSGLLALTAVFLLTPKLLGLLVVLKDGKIGHFGGFFRATFSLLLETLCSVLLAPIRMVFHTQFVLAALSGGKLDWRPISRVGKQPGWHEIVRTHWPATLLAVVWAGGVFSVQRGSLGWLTLFLLPLALSIPITVALSRADAGERCRRLGLFLIPEEQKAQPASSTRLRERANGLIV